jgi:catechol 2,3-dioxygenase-like lactoylglutathione lyase family enzyme
MTTDPVLPKTARERGRVAPARLAHFVRKTSRFGEMLEWYQNVLEAEIVYSNEMLAFLTYDDEHHRVAIIAIPGLVDPPPNAAGTDHIAFTYASLDELLHTYKRLKEAGIEPFWAINHGPTTSLYYKDPDGNSIETQIDNFATLEDIDEWFRGGAFQENPIGVVFDPDELVARHAAGVPFRELVERPALPEGKTPFDMLRS